jgi:transcriptional regulator with XRE-family HTH domain
MDFSPMTLGDKLRELRERKGMSQKELAEAVGFKQPSIARWETGEVAPSFGDLQKLCAALGVKLRVFEDCNFAEAEEKRGRGRPKKS